MLCMSLIFGKVDKATLPTMFTGFVPEESEPRNVTMPLPLTTPSANYPAFLLWLQILAPMLSIFGDKLISMVVMFVFANWVWPLVKGTLRVLFPEATPAVKNDDNKGSNTGESKPPVVETPHNTPNTTSATANDNHNQGSDTEKSQPPVVGTPKNQPTSPQPTPANDDKKGLTTEEPKPPVVTTPNNQSTPPEATSANDDMQGLTTEASKPPVVDSRNNAPESTAAEAPSAEANGNNKGSDTEESQPAPAETPNTTPNSPTHEEELADLRAEKDEVIVNLRRSSASAAQAVRRLSQGCPSFRRDLRAVLDPRGLYEPCVHVIRIARNLTDDFNRVCKALERKKKQLQEALIVPEKVELAAKDEQISLLSADNTRLNKRVDDLEEGQRSSYQAAELSFSHERRSFAEKEERLRERVGNAQRQLNQSISREQHGLVTAQVTQAAERFRQEEREKNDAVEQQNALSTELEDEKARVQELQTAKDAAEAAREHFESELTAKKDELELANEKIQQAEGRITTLEEEATTHYGELREAQIRARNAETQVAQNTTIVNDLKGELPEVQNQAEESSGSKEPSANLATTAAALENTPIPETEDHNEPSSSKGKGKEIATQDPKGKGKAKETEEVQETADAAEQIVQKAIEEQLRGEIQRLDTENKELQRNLDNRPATTAESSTQPPLGKGKEIATHDPKGKGKAKETEEVQETADAGDQSLQKAIEEQLRGEIQRLQRNLDSLPATVAESSTQTPAQAPAQLTEAEKQALFRQGYEKAVADCEPKARGLIESAVQKERLAAGEQLATAVDQKEQAVRATATQRWNNREAEVSSNFGAEVERVVGERTIGLRADLDAAVQRAAQAEQRATSSASDQQVITSDLKAAQVKAEAMEATARSQYDRANTAEGQATTATNRALAAEAEVGNFRTGKQAQDGRIRDLHEQMRVLQAKYPRNYALKEAEINSNNDARVRGGNLIDEILNRSYDWLSKKVCMRLVYANEVISAFTLTLSQPATKYNQEEFLYRLYDVEVDKKEYLSLELEKRVVLVNQCRAVNARLMGLKELITADFEPTNETLLHEIFKVRGDEGVEWRDMEPDPEPESDEDEEDEDEEDEDEEDEDEDDDDDDDDGDDSHPTASEVSSTPRKAPLFHPLGGPSQPAATQNITASNSLKRKGDDEEEAGPSKRKDSSDVGMRPVAGSSNQQGLSFPEADDDQKETKLEPQSDLLSSSSLERFGAASAPRIQSNDHIDISPHVPGSSSSPIPPNVPTPPINPSNPSESPSLADHPLHPKPTRIPGPKPEAFLSSSNQKGRLGTAAQTQETALSPAGGLTGVSFSSPKNIALGILPEVRKYTRLSGRTDTVLSRPPPNPSAAKQPPPDLPRAVVVGSRNGGQGNATRASASRRRSHSFRLPGRGRRPEFRF